MLPQCEKDVKENDGVALPGSCQPAAEGASLGLSEVKAEKSGFLASFDKDHDGKVSASEILAGGSRVLRAVSSSGSKDEKAPIQK